MIKLREILIYVLSCLLGYFTGVIFIGGEDNLEQLEVGYLYNSKVVKKVFTGSKVLYDIESGYYLIIAADSTEQLVMLDDRAQTLYTTIKGLEKGTWITLIR